MESVSATMTLQSANGNKSKAQSAQRSNFIKIERNVYRVKATSQQFTECNCAQMKFENYLQSCANRLLFIECDPETCSFGRLCENMTIQKSRPLVGLFVCDIPKGYGLKTDRAIDKGTFLIEYVGEIVSSAEFRMRSQNDYEQNLHNYGMTLGQKMVIDATKQGNISRFINHSCDPNCEVQK